jgi:hypothetical protein
MRGYYEMYLNEIECDYGQESTIQDWDRGRFF